MRFLWYRVFLLATVFLLALYFLIKYEYLVGNEYKSFFELSKLVLSSINGVLLSSVAAILFFKEKTIQKALEKYFNPINKELKSISIELENQILALRQSTETAINIEELLGPLSGLKGLWIQFIPNLKDTHNELSIAELKFCNTKSKYIFDGINYDTEQGTEKCRWQTVGHLRLNRLTDGGVPWVNYLYQNLENPDSVGMGKLYLSIRDEKVDINYGFFFDEGESNYQYHPMLLIRAESISEVKNGITISSVSDVDSDKIMRLKEQYFKSWESQLRNQSK